MRLTTTFSLLLASLAVAPSVLSYPFAGDLLVLSIRVFVRGTLKLILFRRSSTDLEERGVDYDYDVFARGVEYGDELYERSSEEDDVTLLARALVDALAARTEDRKSVV